MQIIFFINDSLESEFLKQAMIMEITFDNIIHILLKPILLQVFLCYIALALYRKKFYFNFIYLIINYFFKFINKNK